ncbi:Protein of unknown function [Gryllus bimaculatus]|nr:Protein of unknown function [Gryllus bimaculatus]
MKRIQALEAYPAVFQSVFQQKVGELNFTPPASIEEDQPSRQHVVASSKEMCQKPETMIFTIILISIRNRSIVRLVRLVHRIKSPDSQGPRKMCQ